MKQAQVVTLPEEYKYLISRYQYSFIRKADNIAFLLSQHFDDNTDEYCNTQKINDILEEAIDEVMSLSDTMYSTAAILLDDMTAIRATNIRTDKYTNYLYVGES